MKKLLMFMFLSTTVSCLGQISQMRFDFSPAFIEKSQVSIEKQKDGYTLTIKTDKINENCHLTESAMADLNNFLADYPKRKATEDSLLRVKKLDLRVKKVDAKNLSLEGVDTTLEKLLKSVVIVSPSDGVGVFLDVVDSKGSITYNMSNPTYGTINHALMYVLFDLMDASFKKPETIKYVNQLRRYIPHV